MTRPDEPRPATVRSTLDTLRGVGRAVIACSGGADSSALTWLAHQAGIEARVVHVNHHLRPDAHLCERSARALAERVGMAIEVVHLDGGALRADGRGIEAAARAARYRVIAARCAADESILTAHTAEDRVETLLMRLVQGAGLTALAGPRERNEISGAKVVRPLLDWMRADVDAYLAAQDWTPSTDPSNADRSHLRNRIRADVMRPLIAIADGAVLARSARRIADDAELLRELVAAQLEAVARPLAADDWLLSRDRWRAASSAVRSAVLHALVARLDGVRPNEVLIASIAGVVEAGEGAVDGPGLRVESTGKFTRIARVEARTAALPPPLIAIAVQLPGTTATPFGDLVATVGGEAMAELPRGDDGSLGWTIDLEPEVIVEPLVVRLVDSDDRWTPAGASRSGRVIDRLARDGHGAVARRALPAVADHLGVLWVPGVRASGRAVGRGLRLRWIPF